LFKIFFINFDSSYKRYIYGKPIYTRLVPIWLCMMITWLDETRYSQMALPAVHASAVTGLSCHYTSTLQTRRRCLREGDMQRGTAPLRLATVWAIAEYFGPSQSPSGTLMGWPVQIHLRLRHFIHNDDPIQIPATPNPTRQTAAAPLRLFLLAIDY
jgi:hypothetical protein